jgi:hypothetical protein
MDSTASRQNQRPTFLLALQRSGFPKIVSKQILRQKRRDAIPLSPLEQA